MPCFLSRPLRRRSPPPAIESARLDFSAPDRADSQILNRLLWQALKPGIPMPPPVRSASIMTR